MSELQQVRRAGVVRGNVGTASKVAKGAGGCIFVSLVQHTAWVLELFVCVAWVQVAESKQGR